jgi:hypothetical protein
MWYSSAIVGDHSHRSRVIVLGDPKMTCRYCGSKNQETFEAELSLCFPRMESLRQTPVYVCQRTLICLDCGHTDLKVPAGELRQLKPGLSSPTSPTPSVPDASLSS